MDAPSSNLILCAISGSPFTSSIGFGVSFVKGIILLPFPDDNIIAFIVIFYFLSQDY